VPEQYGFLGLLVKRLGALLVRIGSIGFVLAQTLPASMEYYPTSGIIRSVTNKVSTLPLDAHRIVPRSFRVYSSCTAMSF
jgi:hypothetical protein